MKERFYGIDLLRIIAISAVVMLHTLGRSGLLESSIDSQYNTAWLLETAAYFAVDCFAVISGFVGYSEKDRKLKITRMLDLWLQAVFYGLAAVLVFTFFTNVNVESDDLITALFPLIKGEYWFLSAYFGMFIFSNILNRAVRSSDEKTLKVHIVMIIALLIVIESITVKINKDYSLFDFEKGYNSFWLLLMYYVGACIRKTELYKNYKNKTLTLLIAASALVIFSWGWLVVFTKLKPDYKIGGYWERFFVEYISPTIVLIAIIMVVIFANREYGEKTQKLISIIAPSAFSVYLLNSQPLIVRHFYNRENLEFLLKLNGIKLVAAVLLLVFAFVISALLIDRIRMMIFKLCRIKQLENRLQIKIDERF